MATPGLKNEIVQLRKLNLGNQSVDRPAVGFLVTLMVASAIQAFTYDGAIKFMMIKANFGGLVCEILAGYEIHHGAEHRYYQDLGLFQKQKCEFYLEVDISRGIFMFQDIQKGELNVSGQSVVPQKQRNIPN